MRTIGGNRRISARIVGVLLAAVVPLVAIGCAPPPPGTRYLDPTFGVTVQKDVTYGTVTDFKGNTFDLTLDLYTPAGDTVTNRPVVIYAHGGGFTAGDKAESGFSNDFAKRGYVAASINYRLRPGTSISFGNPNDPNAIQAVFDAIHDGQTSIRWFRAHAAQLGIDPDRIAFTGSSAGAVMAVGISLQWNSIDYAGGWPGLSNRACLAVANAGALVPGLADAQDTPALFYHGTNDTTVPYALGQQTEQALANAGVPAAFFSFAGVGHVVPFNQVAPTLFPIMANQVAHGDCARWAATPPT